MTSKEKLDEIELHFAYWINNLSRHELITNNVRIICEALCKALIIKSKLEHQGTNIILGKTPFLESVAPLQPLTFEDLIKVVDKLQYFRNAKSIKIQLDLIRTLTNPSSHSSNNNIDNTTEDDLILCQTSLLQILKWFYDKIKLPIPSAIQLVIEDHPNSIATGIYIDSQWLEFMRLCDDFDRRYQYILVSPSQISDDSSVPQSFAKLPWRLVLDFDNKTDEHEKGLLYNFEAMYGSAYRKVFTIEDKPDFDPKFEHYWFLANGQGSIAPISDPALWRSRYKKFLSDKLYQAFNKGSRLKSRVVVMIDIAPNYAQAIIDEFNRVDEQNIKYILCSYNYSYETIFENYTNAVHLRISPEEIATGIKNTINFDTPQSQQHQILIPHKNNEGKTRAFVAVNHSDYDYLYSLGIELVFKGIEQSEPTDERLDDFFKGGMVSWRDLYEQKDITRNCLEPFIKRLRNELEKNRLNEIEFIHEAGAGGTTISRRLAYDLSSDYPVVILRVYEPKKTISALRIIYDQYTKSSLPFLIVAELFEVRDLDQLYRDLAQANKNAVILTVRRGMVSAAKDKKFTLKAQLDLNEADTFTSTFSNLVQARREKIQAIKRDFRQNPKYISPFLFGLVAYDGDFQGIDQYIEKCLHESTLEQKKLVGFLCIIYHFTQKSVPAELFSSLFGIDRSKCDLVEILGTDNPIFELLHEEYEADENLNIWRPRYAILATVAMKILLSGSTLDKENWKSSLSIWLTDMITYIATSMPYLDEETKQILNALFIDRIESDEFSSIKEPFTDLIKALAPSDGQQIFEKLTNYYPDEAHFHGHFARYLYHRNIGIRDYAKAIVEAEISLDIQPRDSTLIHTLGMCYREQAEALMENYERQGLLAEDVEEDVKAFVELSCEKFDICIDLEPDAVYGHEAQIRILLKALDFGFKAHSATIREIFISNPQNEWYSKKLDKVTTLLEQATYVIEQAKGLEKKDKINKSAQYINECEGYFLKTLGRSIAAKDKFESLVKNTPSGYQYMRPHYRRMFVMCLLASKATSQKDIFNAWGHISQAELVKCVEYLSDNIFEDAPNTQNIRLWLQAVRYLQNPPSIEDCLTKVSNWTQIAGQNIISLLEGYYYLYVLNAIKAINKGSAFDPTSVQTVKDLKEKMKHFIKNEKFCFEWYGQGVGIRQMMSHKTIGDFTPDFISRNVHLLKEVTGRIKEVNSSQHGLIILDCGLEAFFVPNVGGFTEKNKNDRVTFFVGFRYDQIQAWSVTPFNKIDAANPVSAKIVEEAPTKISTTTPIKEDLTVLFENEKPRILEPQFPDKIYTGVIRSINANDAYIESTEVDLLVRFGKKHLTNCQFQNLKISFPVSFTINFEKQTPLMDKTGKNYLARKVRAIFGG